MWADLHVHTTASDGTDTPREVVVRAASVGLSAIAIADHDTLEGIVPAVEAGKEIGLEVVPAIELGTELEGREIHVLGYLMDLYNEDFLSRLAFFRRTREERGLKIVNILKHMGLNISYEQVLEISGGGSVGRPHIARALVQSGVVGSLEEAFHIYIGNGKCAYVPRFKYSPIEAVRLIRRAGGVAVLAHPGLGQGYDQFILPLVKEGLQGLEVYHPGHDPEMSRYYLEFCKRHGLLATGGSDYHGLSHKEHNSLGKVKVSYEVVETLRQLASQGVG